jgi:tRNA-5-methyluridine54 2-sulfurtransferase
MRCRKCEEKAVINMRQHKLSLCSAHFIDWLEDHVARAIHRYRMFDRADRLLLAVSGGKDSLVLWEILTNLGYSVDGLYINLGIDQGIDYSRQSAEVSSRFAADRGLKLIQVHVSEEYGFSIPEAAGRTYRTKNRTCSICGLTKRHIFDQQASCADYDVLITGHNLDDEAAVLFGNTTHWISRYLARQSPVLEAEGGFVRKVKPLCRTYERETAAYALLKGIAYFEEECPFSKDATSLEHKILLNEIEASRPGFKQQFYITYLKAKEEGLFNPSLFDRSDIHRCSRCSQPTSNNDICSFCRTWEKITSSTDHSTNDGHG